MTQSWRESWFKVGALAKLGPVLKFIDFTGNGERLPKGGCVDRLTAKARRYATDSVGVTGLFAGAQASHLICRR